jgi:hypothetical protein
LQCALKDLVEEYWGRLDPRNPMPGPGSLDRIAHITSKYGRFKDGVADNGIDFATWLDDDMSQCDDSPSRKLQQEALLQIDYTHSRAFCTMCGSEYELTEEEWVVRSECVMGRNYEPWTHRSITDILHGGFAFGWKQTCEVCGEHVEREMTRYLEAAPQILRVVINISGNVKSKVFKWLNPFKIQRKIYLTKHQRNDTLPLRYTLSSVIAHGGPGDNIEHLITEEEADRMNKNGTDPENEETPRRKELQEQKELLRNVPSIEIQDEAGWPARNMSPETVWNTADFVGTEELTEEDLAEIFDHEENESSLGDGLGEPEHLPQEEVPEEGSCCQLQ